MADYPRSCPKGQTKRSVPYALYYHGNTLSYTRRVWPSLTGGVGRTVVCACRRPSAVKKCINRGPTRTLADEHSRTR
jgi:hypothetical protein